MIFFSRLVFCTFILVFVFGFHVNILHSQDHESGKKNSNICYSCNVLALDQICENFDLVPEGNVFPWMGTESTFTGSENSSSKIVPSLDLDSPYPINSVLQILQGGNASMQIERTMDMAPARVEFLMFVPNGKAGAFQLWINSTFIPPVDVLINNGVLKWGELQFPFYSHDQWFRVAMIIQPLESEIELFVNDVYIGKKSILADAITEVSFVRFYTPAVSGVFDAMYDHVSYTKVFVNEPLCNSSGNSPVKITGLGTVGCSDFYNIVCANNLGYTDCETVNGSCPNVIDCPEETSPKKNEELVSLNPILRWTMGGLNPKGYRLSVGTDSEAINILNNKDIGESQSYALYNLLPFTRYYWKLTIYDNSGQTKICKSEFVTRGNQETMSCDFGYLARDNETFENYALGTLKNKAKYKFTVSESTPEQNVAIVSTNPLQEGKVLSMSGKYSVSYDIERQELQDRLCRIDIRFLVEQNKTGQLAIYGDKENIAITARFQNGRADVFVNGLGFGYFEFQSGQWNTMVIIADTKANHIDVWFKNKHVGRANEFYHNGIHKMDFYSNSSGLNSGMLVSQIGYREKLSEKIPLFHLDNQAKSKNFDQGYSVNSLLEETSLRICADTDSSFIKLFDLSIANKIGTKDILNIVPSDPEKYKGNIEIEQINNDSRVFKLNHPDLVYTEAISDDFTFQVYDTQFDCICDSFKLEVFRAPIVFMHGINSDQLAFLPTFALFSEKSIYPLGFLRLIDYSHYDLESIDKITFFYRPLQNGIDKVKEILKNDYGIPVGKVDIIAHSMGGLVSRNYIQTESNLPNGYRNDVYRLITINTPHGGTQISDFMYDKSWLANVDECNSLARFVLSPNQALYDMQTQSDFIKKLNFSQNISIGKASNVKVHVITSSYEPSICNLKNIFCQELHDMVVPLSSQLAGLNLSNSSYYIGLRHDLILKDEKLNEDLFSLLNVRTTQLKFADNWFGMVSLNYCSPIVLNTFNTVENNSNYNIKFIIPSNNSIYDIDEKIQFVFQHTGNIHKKMFLVKGKIGELLNTNSFELNTNDLEIGTNIIYLQGFDTINRIMVTDSISILVQSPTQIDSILTYQENVQIRVRECVDLNLFISAYGQMVNINDFNGINLQSFNNRVSTNGFTICGLSVGQDSLIVTYKSKTLIIYIEVIPNPCQTNKEAQIVEIPTGKVCVGIEKELTLLNEHIINGWNFNNSERSVKVNKDATFVLYWMDSLYCTYYDTVSVVFYKPLQLGIASDFMVCKDQPVMIQIPNQFTNISYNGIPSTNPVNLNSSGTYIINALDNNGCNSMDTVVVSHFNTIPATIDIMPSNVLCPGDTIKLLVQSDGRFLWNTGDLSKELYVVEGGPYSVTVTDINNCISEDSVFIFSSHLVDFSLGSDTIVTGSFLPLQLNLSPTDKVVWSTGSTNHFLIITSPGSYWVEITDNLGCIVRDTILIDFLSSTTDIVQKITLYPNPAKDEVIFKHQNPFLIGKRLKIYDNMGRLFKELTIDSFEKSIDLTYLPSGIALISIVELNKSFKIIKNE